MSVIGHLIKSGKKVKLLLKHLAVKCTLKKYTFIGTVAQERFWTSQHIVEITFVFLNIKL